jgi:ABC-type nitrate/sulfonate/bicarbonate transport system substrate-binding protein
MSSFRTLRLALCAACVIALSTVSASSAAIDSSAAGVQQAGRDNLSLAYTVTTPNLSDIAIFYARDHRIFAKYRLNVKFDTLNGDTLGLQALIGGSDDISWISNQLLYQAIGQGAEIQGFLENAPVQDYLLVSTKDVPSIKGLEGHVLGTSGPGGIAEVLPFLAIDRAGGDTSKVRTVNVGGSSGRATALAAGRVDAGILHVTEAVQFLAKNPGRYKILANLGKTLPNMQFVVFAAKRSTLASKRDALTRFSMAILEAQRRVAADFQTAYNEFHAYRPDLDMYTVKRAYRILKSIGAYDIRGGMARPRFNFTVNALLSQKLIEKPVTYQQAYNTSLRDAALKRLPPATKPAPKKK